MQILILYLLCALATVYSVDYYELLGISKDADNREIRRAFKKLALKLHPDKNMEEEKAHEQFIAINKAYEVLKDEETRKKYDLYGEEGLKEDFGNSWRGNYRSWNYYYESFGIYDDDPEIITLNKNDFVQSVLESTDLWFVNFYSPQCSHCHHLAPVWRELARNFEGVLQIGAVNCEEDWMLCRQQNIYSYPSLILYPLKEKYQGSRDLTSMVDYVLQHLPDNIIKLTSHYFSQIVSMEETASQPWLIITCKNTKGCLDSDEIKKLGVILKDLVKVAEVEKNTDEKICEFINCHAPVSFYFDLNTENPEKNISLHEVEVSEIVKTVLSKLPEPEDYSEESFKEMITTMKNLASSPRLLHFTDKMKSSESNIDLKRLKAILPEVVLGNFDCGKYPSTCAELYLQKFPTFLLFKPNGGYEFHYGRVTAYDVARFVREALPSQVYTLTPSDFPRVTESGQSWFIDFFAPWCPPCMQFLPQWRKASQSSGHLVKFGTVDCSIHVNLCRKELPLSLSHLRYRTPSLRCKESQRAQYRVVPGLSGAISCQDGQSAEFSFFSRIGLIAGSSSCAFWISHEDQGSTDVVKTFTEVSVSIPNFSQH
ncbi:DnaJ subfamily C member 10 [Araneus ventricosus]|uniref:DnaJ homolog subfamily C member 10 n=1 Tax=Araneus ventricosus TaxID=182803 RepID=A0A4Y2E0D0_ARAVE|nr:DnaJ subfamily C member 10 [Araneus ventricosus]